MALVVLFVVMFILIAIRVPIGFAIGGATVVAMMLFSDLDLIVVAQHAFVGVNSFPIMAIPFFILAGCLMTEGGIARRLVDLASSAIGFVTGGLGAVVTLASMFFGAISGSGMATVSAIGATLIPEMKRKGYNVDYSATLTAAAGTLGLLIPPSIALILYGVATNTSIGDLFIATIIPGVLVAAALMIVNYFFAKKESIPKGDPINLKKLWQDFWEAKWAIFTPVIVLGGIYTGVFTPTEAAVVTVVYAWIVSQFIYRELTMKKLYRALVETAVINGITCFLLGFSTSFSAFLAMEQLPSEISGFLLTLTDNKIILLLIINVFLLIVGCVLDLVPATIILAPILLPALSGYGIDPVHFGILFSLNLTIGVITPPYGCNLFVAAAVAGTKLESMLKYVIPMLIAVIVVLLLVTYIPAFSLMLID